MVAFKSLLRNGLRRKSNVVTQVEDQVSILNESLDRFAVADQLYHPGPYWLRHQQPLVNYLRSNGLRNYRQGTQDRKDPAYVLRRFGAAEPLIPPPPHQDADEWNLARFRFAASYGQMKGAKPLAGLSLSRVGNPGDSFTVEGNTYTTLGLNLYMRYAYLCEFVDFDAIKAIVEIGPGSGIQTEILHKLHPHLTSYLFDIPPQSYVCNQYLKTVFGPSLVSMETNANRSGLPAHSPGKIYMFNSWQIPLAKDISIDLFWNAASFNEMEPHLVQNYLNMVGHSRNLYLMSIMEGSRVGISDYRSFLPSHNSGPIEPVLFSTGRLSPQYQNSFWTPFPAEGT